MRLGAVLAAAAAALVVLAAHPAPAAASDDQPWRAAADLRRALTEAQTALVLGDRPRAERLVEQSTRRPLGPLRAAALPSLVAAESAVRAGDSVALEVARTDAWAGILREAQRRATAAARRGDVETARAWLLVREFRPPTRFSRPGADATLALRALAQGRSQPAAAAAAVRADLLDTYQARLRSSLESLDEARIRGFAVSLAGAAASARGYFAVLAPAYADQRGPAAAHRVERLCDRLVAAATAPRTARLRSARAGVDTALEGFRAAPLTEDEQLRRAGQILRFLGLVPIEYERGVDGGRVTLDFEIQEAITFRDGAAQAFGDLEPALIARDRAAAKQMETLLSRLGVALAAAAHHERVADPAIVRATTDQVLDLADSVYPDKWKDAGSSADFDVISATLDRLEGAVAAGQYGDAEQARLEAYAFFEFGPEQRLRGIAPDLFVSVEGLFWYGDAGTPGLAQLVKRRADAAEVATSRRALDVALADAEAAVGAGPTSDFAVVSNTAVIVFREGLEAVLILAALLAGMVGMQAQYRRPLMAGVAGALAATAVTWVVAQTVLESLSRYGEKLEALVSLVAIGVLLLVLNWFYHRVYWGEHLADLHGRKKRLVRVGAGAAVTAQLAGFAALGFSSVYREGFETVLFLQAFSLEAGLPLVLLGVAVGLAATAAVGVLTIALQRKLPHKKMLVATGLLLVWVLVVMVGTTVQSLQVVGWVAVTPVEGLRLPYWAGLWFGLYPTWQGLIAQAAAIVFVLGSYVLAERLRGRRRREILAGARRPAAERQAATERSPA